MWAAPFYWLGSWTEWKEESELSTSGHLSVLWLRMKCDELVQFSAEKSLHHDGPCSHHDGPCSLHDGPCSLHDGPWSHTMMNHAPTPWWTMLTHHDGPCSHTMMDHALTMMDHGPIPWWTIPHTMMDTCSHIMMGHEPTPRWLMPSNILPSSCFGEMFCHNNEESINTGWLRHPHSNRSYELLLFLLSYNTNYFSCCRHTTPRRSNLRECCFLLLW